MRRGALEEPAKRRRCASGRAPGPDLGVSARNGARPRLRGFARHALEPLRTKTRAKTPVVTASGGRGVVATVFLLAATSCSSDADAPAATVPLCDGSSSLTLRIFYVGQSGREVWGSAVRIENGFPSFAVDGQCNYFMAGGWLEDKQARDHGWRRGLVSDDLRRALEARAGAEDLASAYACSGSGGADAPPVIVANARSSVICFSDVDESVGEALTVIRQRAGELWAAAQPLDGDLRVTVRQASGLEPPRRYPWPGGLALGDFELDSGSLYLEPEGRSKSVSAADAPPLRAIREQYLIDTRPGVLYDAEGIPIIDGETPATMFMRDALPYEDERGLLPLPEEMQ